MVVRRMVIKPITQCYRELDFQPRTTWPTVLPAFAWRGYLLCGFERRSGDAVELATSSLVDVLLSVYPELGLAEMARFSALMERAMPELYLELREAMFSAYGWRWCDRLAQTMILLRSLPFKFQSWVDEKKVSARDLAPLLALPNRDEFQPFVTALVQLPVSKSEGVRALELGVELFLMGRPMNDILPSTDVPSAYLHRLERWRRPLSGEHDELWKSDVAQWPWPAHVHGQWQRFGDQAGLEIKIRTTSPQDLSKKLERLQSIGETWSCKM
jgi:hypothetical protein